MAKMAFQPPKAARAARDPNAQALQELAAKMSTAHWTKYGNVFVQTEVLARSTPSTFIVADDPDPAVARTVTTERAPLWTGKQNAYVAEQEIILLDGSPSGSAHRERREFLSGLDSLMSEIVSAVG